MSDSATFISVFSAAVELSVSIFTPMALLTLKSFLLRMTRHEASSTNAAPAATISVSRRSEALSDFLSVLKLIFLGLLII